MLPETSANTRVLLLSLLVVVLFAAAGIIAYNGLSGQPLSIFTGGGGGQCCTGSECAPGVYVCCENQGYFPATQKNGNVPRCTSSPCQQYPAPCVGANKNDAQCAAELSCIKPSGQTAEICGTPVSQITSSPRLGSCGDGKGSSCPSPNAPGKVAVCYLNNCYALDQSKCFHYTGSGNNVLSCDCGCRSRDEVCAGKTGTVTERCSKCNNLAVYDCGGGSGGSGGGTTGPGAGGGGGNNNDDDDDDDSDAKCGESCNSDSDCRPFGANGAPTTCRNGICEAKNCDPGKTLPGANCDCQSFSGQCGQRCGTGYPLCGNGTICRYIVGPSCTKPTQSNWTTYCIPKDAEGIKSNKCVSRDTGNAYIIETASGKTSFTQSDILDLCNPTEKFCGDAKCQSGELCERTTSGGNAYRLCTANNNLDPTGAVVPTCSFSGEDRCQQTPVSSGDVSISVIKSADSVCIASGDYEIEYEIVVRNSSSETAVYSGIVDEINPPSGTSYEIENITGNGSYSNNTIVWPGGSIPAGETVRLSYTLSTNRTGTFVNTVSIDYDSDKTVTYTNSEEILPCGSLPRTNLRDDMIVMLAAILLVLGVIIYRQRIGADLILNIWSGAKELLVFSGIDRREIRTREVKRFEQELLEDKSR